MTPSAGKCVSTELNGAGSWALFWKVPGCWRGRGFILLCLGSRYVTHGSANDPARAEIVIVAASGRPARPAVLCTFLSPSRVVDEWSCLFVRLRCSFPGYLLPADLNVQSFIIINAVSLSRLFLSEMSISLTSNS